VDKKRWETIKSIFAHLCDQSSSFRRNYLEIVCENDSALQLEIEAMLKAHDALVTSEADVKSQQTDFSLVGTSLGEYRLLKLLSTGGMSSVYLGENSSHQQFAIKILPEFLNDQDAAKQRFVREANILNKLSHPGLCEFIELLEVHRKTALVMELVTGRTLEQTLPARPHSLVDVLAVTRDIAEVLDVAHEIGITHRDIKPSNVMMADDGCTKLIDFGIAHFADARLTLTGQIVGSPRYMSPEQWRGIAVDHRTDIWSLGLLLYEMYFRENPFAGDKLIEISAKVLDSEAVVFPASAVQVSTHSESVCQLICHMLQKNPDDRPQRASEIIELIDNIE